MDDDFDDELDDALEDQLEEAREEGRQEASHTIIQSQGSGCGTFGCGCLFGIALLFVAIGFGWCAAPHFN